MACQYGFLLRSAGWKASDPYCVNDRASFSFRVSRGWDRNTLIASNDGHRKGLVVANGQRLRWYVIWYGILSALCNVANDSLPTLADIHLLHSDCLLASHPVPL